MPPDTEPFDERRGARHPIRIIHLGLGAFHRAHQAWYTQGANDAAAQAGGEQWGIEAFTGRSAAAAIALEAQAGLYSLIERAEEGDTARLIESISRASDGADAARWRTSFGLPGVAVVTLTVTEAGYHLTPAAVLDLDDCAVRSDLSRLSADGLVSLDTAPGRIVDGLRSRMRAGLAGVAIVSCDNLPNNGQILHDSVLTIAKLVDASLAAWIDANVTFVSTMVDRITPATTPADVETARELTGLADTVPVVTEPFSEWILSGEFPAGRPRWESAGARFVERIAPFEQRKLWLLNAAHSLLAYRGLLRGHETVSAAMLDRDCSSVVEELWNEMRPVLEFEPAEIDAALRALRARFANARIEHRLAQIATDGSRKLGPRIITPMRRRLERGLPVGAAQAATLAAWALHLSGPFRRDSGSDALAVALDSRSDPRSTAQAVIGFLAPDLLATPDLLAAADLLNVVSGQIEHLRSTTESSDTR